MRLQLTEGLIIVAFCALIVTATAEGITQQAATSGQPTAALTPQDMIDFAEKQGREFDPEASSLFINGEHVQTVIQRCWNHDNERYRQFLKNGHAPHENLDLFYSDKPVPEITDAIG
jgi:hypothetical protein